MGGAFVAIIFGTLYWADGGCHKKGGMSGIWEYGEQEGANTVRRLILEQGGKITERIGPRYGVGKSFLDEGTYYIEEGPPRKIIFKVRKSSGLLRYRHEKDFIILDDGNIAAGNVILKKL